MSVGDDPATAPGPGPIARWPRRPRRATSGIASSVSQVLWVWRPSSKVNVGRIGGRRSPAPASSSSVPSHAGRLWDLRLTDIRDGHLHLPGRSMPIAPPAREQPRAYLDCCATHWPATANPHLFIH